MNRFLEINFSTCSIQSNPMNKLLYFISGLVLLFAQAEAQTSLSGLINTDLVLNAAGSPYMVGANVIVSKGVKLSIRPGVALVGPSQSSVKIVVNGTVEAMGTADSMISVGSVEFNFTKDATDYDPATGKGSQFAYCNFTNPTGKLTYQIYLEKMAIRVHRSRFQDMTYPIYGAGSDSNRIYLTHTVFENIKNSFGYPVYAYNKGSVLMMDYCRVINYGSLYIAEHTEIKNSYFRPLSSYSLLYFNYYSHRFVFQCNLVRKARSVFDWTTTTQFPVRARISENEFDSCQTVFRLTCMGKFDSLMVSRNNFRRFTQRNIEFVTCTSSTGTYTSLPFKGNYWIATDTNDILNTIMDYRQNVQIPFKVDVTGFKTSPVSQCWPSVQGGTNKMVASGLGTQLGVWPNPAGSYALVRITGFSPQDIIWSFYNTSGQQIYPLVTHESKDIYRINTQDLPSGIYTIQCNDFKSFAYGKLFKK